MTMRLQQVDPTLPKQSICRLTFKISMSVSEIPVLTGYELISCRLKMSSRPQTEMVDRCMFLSEFLVSADG